MKRYFWGSLLLIPLLLAGIMGLTLSADAETPKYIALTFDDGPRRETTERLLDGLEERGAKATFFVIGEQIAGNEDLILRMAEEGHQIGNHTYTHSNLQKSSAEQVVTEINKTEVALNTILGGERQYWLRPPWGLVSSNRQSLIHTPMIHWSIDPEDWRRLNAQQVAEQVIREAKDGSIILLHDYYPTSVDAALAIVDALQREGYVFVTVEELFRQKGVTPEKGVLYKTPTKKYPSA